MSKLSSILNGGAASGGNSKSIVARIGSLGQRYTDPLALIGGKKYTGALETLADKSNSFFRTIGKPGMKVDQAINPVRRFVPGVDQVASWTEHKPVDTAAIVAGSYFGGSALHNSGAQNHGLGRQNQGLMRFRPMNMQSQGQQQQQQTPNPWLEQLQQQEEQRRQQQMIQQMLAQALARQQQGPVLS